MQVCNNCGAKLNDNVSFCSNCGANVPTSQPAYPQMSTKTPISIGG